MLSFVLILASLTGCGRREAKSEKEEPALQASVQPSEPVPDASLEKTPQSTSQQSIQEAGAEPENGISIDKAIGVLNGTTYTNELFGFTMEIPEGWFFASKDDLVMINQLGADFVKQSSGNESMIDLAMQKVLPLFFTSRYSLTQQSQTNANINCIAENIGLAGSLVQNGKDYITLASQAIKAQGLDYAFGEIKETKIGKADFAYADGVLKMNGMEIKQTMYVTLKDKFSLVMTLTHFSDEDKNQLEDIIKSVSFK